MRLAVGDFGPSLAVSWRGHCSARFCRPSFAVTLPNQHLLDVLGVRGGLEGAAVSAVEISEVVLLGVCSRRETRE